MANNRLFLVDEETGDHILLAKGFGDWDLRADEGLLRKFLEVHDFAGAQGSAPSRLKLKTEDDPDCPPHTKEPWRPSPGERHSP